jgi:hypothetical protein
MTQNYSIPRELPGCVEVEPDRFMPVEKMTADHWRFAEKVETRGRKRIVRQMLKLADACRVPGDVPLLPYLEALASSGNVTMLH